MIKKCKKNIESRDLVIIKIRLRYGDIVIIDIELKRVMINILRFIMCM